MKNWPHDVERLDVPPFGIEVEIRTHLGRKRLATLFVETVGHMYQIVNGERKERPVETRSWQCGEETKELNYARYWRAIT